MVQCIVQKRLDAVYDSQYSIVFVNTSIVGISAYIFILTQSVIPVFCNCGKNKPDHCHLTVLKGSSSHLCFEKKITTV